MNIQVHRPLFFFAALFGASVVLDALKFVAFGKPTLINWESFVHPAWVVLAGIALFLAAYSNRVRQAALYIYLVIFAASYLNVYLGFTEVLTYWCMIFNLVLTAVFFFTQSKHCS